MHHTRMRRTLAVCPSQKRVALAALTLTLVSTFALALFSPPAHASAPGAWKKLQTDTTKACLAQSGFKNAKVVEGPVWFQSHVVYKISGTWPQAHMKGKTGKVFCLHPFPKGEPEISEDSPS